MKKFECIIFSIFFFLTSPAIAIELDEVVVGAIYYHDAWNNNQRAKVVAIRGQKVEIVYLEGSKAGEVDRVYPRDLLTRTDSQNEAAGDAMEGVAVGIVAVAAFVCLVNPESCEDKKTSKYAKERKTNYNKPKYLYFHNDCGAPISLAVTYKNQMSKWLTIGWWNLPAYEGRFLASDDTKILLSSNDLYYYAESKKSGLTWKGDDYRASFNDRSLGMRKTDVAVNTQGNYSYSINCAEDDPLNGKYLLGFNGHNIEYFTYNNAKFEYGVEVSSVVSGMPASEAGLQSGDVIYKIDGQNVSGMEYLLSFINNRKEPWSSINISYVRKGELYSKTLNPKRKR